MSVAADTDARSRQSRIISRLDFHIEPNITISQLNALIHGAHYEDGVRELGEALARQYWRR